MTRPRLFGFQVNHMPGVVQAELTLLYIFYLAVGLVCVDDDDNLMLSIGAGPLAGSLALGVTNNWLK